MAVIKIVESQSKKTKCSCCGEIIATCEKFSKIGRENYCHKTNCHTKYLPLNHPNAVHEQQDDERHLREREEYAAYQAAGCASEFFSDRDAGYIR